MGSDKWLTATIDEIKASIPHSTALGPFGSTIRAENFVLTGVPVIRGLNLNAERFKDDGFVFIADKKADELDSANAFPDDLVFVYIGSIGQVGIIPSNSSYSRYIISQNLMKLTCDLEKVDRQYTELCGKSESGILELALRCQHKLPGGYQWLTPRTIAKPSEEVKRRLNRCCTSGCGRRCA